MKNRLISRSGIVIAICSLFAVSNNLWAQTPACQVSNVSFANITGNSVEISWTPGCGNGRLVQVNSSNSFGGGCGLPTDGNFYAFNTDFTLAPSSWCSGVRAAYRGSNNSVVITGLTSGSTYYFRVFEYNDIGANIYYNTTNSSSVYSIALIPVTPLGIFQRTTNTVTAILGPITTGQATLLAGIVGDTFTSTPTNGVQYCAQNTFGLGEVLPGGSFALEMFRHGASGCFFSCSQNNNPTTPVQITGLAPGTTYTFKAFPATTPGGCGDGLAYNLAGFPVTFTTLVLEPTTQATSLQIQPISSSSFALSWTNGNGGERLVVARQGATISTLPLDGVPYGSTTDFQSAPDIGSGTKVVYKGSANTTVVTGLSPATSYAFQVIEVNGSGASSNYLTSGLPVIRKTLDTEPAGHASVFAASTGGATQVNLSFSPASSIANAVGFLILRTQNGQTPTAGNVTDGLRPADLVLPVGTTLASVITNNEDTNFSNSGLSAATLFTYALVPFNYNGVDNETYNYLTSAPLPTTSATTFAQEPPAQPHSLTFSALGSNSYVLSFTAPSGEHSGYLAIRRKAALPTGVPLDGQEYTIGQALGDGVIAYVGGLTGFPQTSLDANSVYYFHIFAYNGSGTAINYRTLSPLEVSRTTLQLEPSAQPTSIGFDNITSNSMRLSFAAPFPSSDGYLIVRKQGGIPSGVPTDGIHYNVNTVLGDGTVVSSGLIDDLLQTTLQSNTNYGYRVFAFNGTGAAINYRTTTPLAGSQITKFEAPVAISPNNVTTSTAEARWSALAGATEYRIDLSADGFQSIVAGYGDYPVIGGGTTANLSDLVSGTFYRYRVRAINAAGESLNSNEVEF